MIYTPKQKAVAEMQQLFQAVEKGADRKKVQNKVRKKTNCNPPKFNQLKAKAIH